MRSLYEFCRALRVIYGIDIRYMIQFFAMNPYLTFFSFYIHVSLTASESIEESNPT